MLFIRSYMSMQAIKNIKIKIVKIMKRKQALTMHNDDGTHTGDKCGGWD